MQLSRFSLTAAMFMGLVYCSMVPPQATADEPFAIRTVYTRPRHNIPDLPYALSASINSEGRVAIDDNTYRYSYGIMRLIETASGIERVTKYDIPLDLGDGQFSAISYAWSVGALISDDNRTAYSCSLEDGPFQCLVSHHLDGPADVIVSDDSPVPGFPADVKFFLLAPPSSGTVGEYRYSRAGSFSFHATLLRQAGTPNRWGSIWIGNETGLTAVAQKGDRAPGTDDSVAFSGGFTTYFESMVDEGYRAPCINGNDEVAFVGGLMGDSVDTTNNAGIWVGAPNALNLVVRKGQHISGMADDETLGIFLCNPAINNAGQIAFNAQINDGNGEYPYYYDAVFSDVAGQIQVIMRDGMPAPGTPKDVVFDSRGTFAPSHYEEQYILKTPLVDDSGLVAFMGYLRGEGVDRTNSVGLWTKHQDEPLELLARMGDAAPGMGESVVFDEIGWDSNYEECIHDLPAPGFSLNGNGQVAFFANVRGDGIDGWNNGGIWATDKNGELHLVVREGDQVRGESGEMLTIGSFWFSQGGGGSDGNARAFNENGELVFMAYASDGTTGSIGTFVATIPEPTTLLLLGFGVCLTARQRRREV